MFHTHARTRTRTHTFSFSFSLSFSFFLSLPPFLSFSFSFSLSLSLSLSLSFDFQQARFIEEIKMRLCVWSTLRWNLMAPQISRRHTRNANGFNSSVHAALATTPRERNAKKMWWNVFFYYSLSFFQKTAGEGRERERREREGGPKKERK